MKFQITAQNRITMQKAGLKNTRKLFSFIYDEHPWTQKERNSNILIITFQCKTKRRKKFMKVQGVIKLKEKGVKFNFHSLALLLVLSDGYFSYYILNEIFLVFFFV